MKERAILLCSTVFNESKKYGFTTCMAGITESGEMRRIYPVTFEEFLRAKLHKRQYIEYNIRDRNPEKHRPESVKIEKNSLTGLKSSNGNSDIMPYDNVMDLVNPYITTIEQFRFDSMHNKASLGFISPRITGSHIDAISQSDQSKLFFGGFSPDEYLIRFKYQFLCSESCKTSHEVSCFEMEMYQLYRNLIKSEQVKDTIYDKIKYRFDTWMRDRRVVFMIGTHYMRKQIPMVISVLHMSCSTGTKQQLLFSNKFKSVSKHQQTLPF